MVPVTQRWPVKASREVTGSNTVVLVRTGMAIGAVLCFLQHKIQIPLSRIGFTPAGLLPICGLRVFRSEVQEPTPVFTLEATILVGFKSCWPTVPFVSFRTISTAARGGASQHGVEEKYLENSDRAAVTRKNGSQSCAAPQYICQFASSPPGPYLQRSMSCLVSSSVVLAVFSAIVCRALCYC